MGDHQIQQLSRREKYIPEVCNEQISYLKKRIYPFEYYRIKDSIGGGWVAVGWWCCSLGFLGLLVGGCFGVFLGSAPGWIPPPRTPRLGSTPGMTPEYPVFGHILPLFLPPIIL